MFDKAFLICLAIFLLLFGIAAVTNIEVVWMAPLTGLMALLAGIIGMIKAFR